MNKKAEKDPVKQERLNQVYRHLFSSGDIHSQIELADKLKMQRSGLSAAMNGNAAYLTKNLFMKVCATFPNTFNLDYLLNGTGSLLLKENIPKSDIAVADNMLELYARMIRSVDDLRIQLREEIQQTQQLRTTLQQTVDILIQELHRVQYITPHSYGIAAEEMSNQ